MPEGRLDFVANNKGLKIFVGFAHTPQCPGEASWVFKCKKDNGRLIVVFGSAGERDRSKRPLMGKIVSDFADIVVFDSRGYEKRVSDRY